MDDESLMNMLHRWQHLKDEDGWRDVLYLHDKDDSEGGWYYGKDMIVWDKWKRTASSPGVGMLIGWGF